MRKILIAGALMLALSSLALGQEKPAPSLVMKDLEGRTLRLSGYKGRVVLLNFWATWCAPCRAEMPALDALEGKSGGGDFEVVAINVDTGDDSKPKAFLSEIGVQKLGY